MSDLPAAIPAATLILMRAGRAGPPELLMTERTGDDGVRGRRAGLSRRADRPRRSCDRRAASGLARRRGADRGDPRDDRGDRHRAGARARRRTRRGRRAARRDRAARSRSRRCSTRPGPRARSRRADAVRALVPQFPRDPALRHPLLPRRGAGRTRPRRWSPRPKRCAPSGRAPRTSSPRSRPAAPTPSSRPGAISSGWPRFGSIAEARADAARHPVEKITPWVEERGGEPLRLHPRGDRLSGDRRAAGDGAAALMRMRRCGLVLARSCSRRWRLGGLLALRPCPAASRGRALDRARPRATRSAASPAASSPALGEEPRAAGPC